MKILFLSVPTGQGHHQTAKAVVEHFQGNEEVECRFLDVVDNISPVLADSLQKGYLLSTKMTPRVYGTLYDLTDKRDHTKEEGLGRLFKTPLNNKLLKYIKLFNPDIIVCTHVFAAIALSYLKRKYPIRAKSIAIVTDFTIHPYWETTELDYYVTASELLSFQAIKKGIPTQKLKPFGIPIQPKFSTKFTKQEACAKLGLDDKFTVLLMMGSMGYGNDVLSSIRSLDGMNENFQLIIVCGNNKKLKEHIDAMHKHKTMITYGYTDEVSTLMDAADCIITKPGGLSTSEAMAKNLPIIMMEPIPGQEDRNKEFMLNNGLAMYISETFPVTEAIYQLINYPHKRDMFKQNMQFFAKPDSAKILGEFITNLCDENKI